MQKLKQVVAVFMAIQTQSDTAMRNKIKLNTIVFRTTQRSASSARSACT